ncbi:MAG: DUF6316 family protein [Candidatus Poribacteria bacterium]
MELNATGLANRFEGRLFSDEGRLYLVIDVDTESGLARVSCRADGGQQVIRMPVSEVALRLSSNSKLRLDGLSTADTSNRIIQQTDGWFFTTREGPKGPYQSDAEANLALSKYILSAQGTSVSGVVDRVPISAN